MPDIDNGAQHDKEDQFRGYPDLGEFAGDAFGQLVVRFEDRAADGHDRQKAGEGDEADDRRLKPHDQERQAQDQEHLDRITHMHPLEDLDQPDPDQDARGKAGEDG